MKKVYSTKHAFQTAFCKRALSILVIVIFATNFGGYSQSTLPAFCTHAKSTLPEGWTQSGLSANTTSIDACGGFSFNMNGVGDYIMVNYDAAATAFSFNLNINTTGSSKTLLVEQSPNGTAWTTAGTYNQGSGNGVKSAALLATSRYVRFRCSARTGGSFDIDGLQVYNTTAFSCYCASASTYTGTDGEYISGIASGTFNNTTGQSNYANYISNGVINTVTQGSTFTVTVTLTNRSASDDIVYIYGDWNNNGNFTDAGELGGQANISSTNTAVTVTVPATATVGTTRLRIRMGDKNHTTAIINAACQTFTYGEVEDYIVEVQVPPSITTETITPATYCPGASVSVPFTATGTYITGNTFTAQLSASNGSFASPTTIGTLAATASGTINAIIPAATPAGTAYQIRVISSTPSVTGTSSASIITVTALSATPVVTSPICIGATTVSGTSSEPNGTVVTVYKNAVSQGTTIVTGGAWTMTVASLVNGDIITANAIASGKCTSATSTSVTVANSAAPVIMPTQICAGATSVSGTASEANGTIITIYINAVSQGTTTVTGGAFTKTGLTLVAGDVITADATAPGKCISTLSASVTVQNVTAAPVVNSPVCAGATSVNGTSTEADGTSILVYKNGIAQTPAVTVTGGVWTKTGLTSAVGNTFTAYATASGKCQSVISNTVTVATSAAPVVSSPICVGNTSVSGTSSEANGTIVTIYKNAVSQGTTTVSGGTWTYAGLPTLVAGEAITATALAPAKCLSVLSNSVTVATSAAPVVNSPICASATSISGTSSEANGTSVLVYKNGVAQTPAVTVTGGAWTKTGLTFVAGDNVTATATASGKCVSAVSATVVVSATPTVFNVTGGGGYCSGGIGTAVGLSGSQTGVNYTLNPGAIVVAGTGSAISFGNQTGAATYTVSAQNTATGCTAAMNGNAAVVINPLPTADAGGNQVVCSGSTTILGTATTASGGTAPYTYAWTPAGNISSSASIARPATTAITGTVNFNVLVTDSKGCIANSSASVTVGNPAKAWNGIGVPSGASEDGNFNDPQNWVPKGVPGACNDVVMNLSGSGFFVGETALVTVNDNTTIKSLTTTLSGTAILSFTPTAFQLYVAPSKNFTVLNNTNVATNINVFGIGSGQTYIIAGANSVIKFNGDLTTTVSNANNANFPLIALTNNSGKFYINGNANLGGIGEDYNNKPASLVFDGATGTTQTITHNSGAQTIYLGGTTTDIGESNSPTVVFTGAGTGGFNVNGNLRVLNTSTLDITSTQFVNRRTGGGVFSVNGGATLRLGAGSGGQTGSNFPSAFTAGSINLNSAATPTSTVEYYGTVAQTVFATPTYGHLVINNNSTKNITAGISVRGNLTIDNNAVFSGATSNIQLGGNWINNVGVAGFTQTGLGVVTMNGTGGQDIGGSAAGGTSFNRLIINDAAGVNLSKSQSVSTLLTLTSGILNIASSNLTIAHAAAIAGSPFSASKMIQADGAGEVRKIATSTGAYLYPVGEKTGTVEYSPVTVNVTAGTGFSSAAFVGVNVRNAKHPNNNSSAHYLNRYWNINQAGLTSCTATVSATYLPADITGTESLISSAQLKGVFNQATNGWLKFSTLGSSTLTATGALLANNQSNAFTGISADNPVASISGGTVTICKGQSVPLSASATGGEPGYIYSWDNGGSLDNPSVANPTATPTATTTYTVTIADINGIKATATKTIIVNDPANIGTQPAANLSGCTTPIVFSVTATGTGISYQWQVSADGGLNYSNITGAPYTGFLTNQLTLNTIDPDMDGYMYRVIVNGAAPCGNVTSDVSKLNVKNIWTGASGTDWNIASNWSGNVLPDISCGTVYVPNKANQPVLNSGTTTVNNLIVYPGALVTVPSGATLEITGVLNAANGSIDAQSGIIKMSGGTQSVSGASFTGRTIDTLINNTTTALNVSSTLNDVLNIKGLLSFGNTNADLNTGDNITLRSTVNGTANLGKVAPGNVISGQAISERYINTGTGVGQHPKSWQFVSANTTGSTVKQSWMENSAPTPGYGVWVTDPSGLANGFDNTSLAPSMKVYNSSNNLLEGIPNTGVQLKNNFGYMLYVRGDRTVNSATGPNSTAKPTTLRAKGNLVTGTQVPITVSAGKLQSIGNPYPAAIDFEKLLLPGGKIDSTFYIWDPTLAGSYNGGGYQTFKAETGWLATPGGGSLYATVSDYHTIQSGQAFFVINSSATDDNITITEDAKVEGTKLVFRGGEGSGDNNGTAANISMLSTMLFSNAGVLTDGNRVVFNDNYSNAVDGRDANKVTNAGENFGLTRDGKSLAVESRRKLQATDTIYYKVSGLTNQTYKLAFAVQNMGYNNLGAELIDKSDNSRKPVSLTDSTIISFQVTSAAASKAADRFMLVFKPLAPLPVNIVSIAANRNNDRSIAITWKVENEINIQKYEVERSADARVFKGILSASPEAVNGGSASYLRTDLSPLAEDNFYRIKATSIGGQVQYSAVVKVAPVKVKGDIGVYPNPVADKNVQIRFTNQPAGEYRIQLTNKLGQIVYSGMAQVSGTVFVKSVPLNPTIAAGNYQLQVISEEGTSTTQQVIVQ